MGAVIAALFSDAFRYVAGTWVHVHWQIQRLNFDVGAADTDAGMKSCLMIGGKWTAPFEE